MPLWKKGDTKAYNLWRKRYRKKKKEDNCCARCYRPLVEDRQVTICANCSDTAVRNIYLRTNLF